jgi:hypothetical protein
MLAGLESRAVSTAPVLRLSLCMPSGAIATAICYATDRRLRHNVDVANRLTRLAALVLLLPALLVAGAGHGYAGYRCRLDRVLRTSCCCPGSDEESPRDSHAVIAKACCCDREVVSLSAPPSHTEDQAHGVPVAPLQVSPLPPLLRLASSLPLPVVNTGVGPPILLLKSSLLI